MFLVDLPLFEKWKLESDARREELIRITSDYHDLIKRFNEPRTTVKGEKILERALKLEMAMKPVRDAADAASSCFMTAVRDGNWHESTNELMLRLQSLVGEFELQCNRYNERCAVFKSEQSA